MYLYLHEIELTRNYTKALEPTTISPSNKKSKPSFYKRLTSASMRNLSILSSSRWILDGQDIPTAIAFDLDESATYASCEESCRDPSRVPEAAVVRILKIDPGAEPVKNSLNQTTLS